jgi:DNA mismatch repair protein MLH3
MSIRQLPEDVVGKLKSSTVIVSLNGAAIGLVGNALDAEAAKINITVDYARGNCTVEDNGCGIPPREFKEDGGLGKLHHTSRYPPDDSLHGRLGNFLASLGTLSLLSISSRSQSHIPHSSILIHNSAVLSRHVPARPEQRLRTFDHGTRVTVRDLFGSMPVRVKQRPDASTDRASIDKEWSQLVHDCAAMLLAWPLPVSVLLRDAAGEREVRLRSANDAELLSRVSSLLMQAALASSGDVKSLVPVSASTSRIQLAGCMSTKPVATRRAQFISIGVQPITNDLGTNPLYEEMNRAFLNSSFSVVEDDLDLSGAGALSGRERGSRRRAERWPMFHLQIRLRDSLNSHDLDDLLDDRGNHLSAVLDLLKAVCYGFLKNHHLRPRKANMSRSTSRDASRALHTSATRKKPTSDLKSISYRSRRGGAMEMRPSSRSSPFDGWQRTKAGRSSSILAEDKRASSRTDSSGTARLTENRLVGEGGQLLRKPFADVDDFPPDPALQESGHFRMFGRLERRAESALTSTPAAAQPSAQPDTAQHSSTPTQLQTLQKSGDNAVFEDAPPPIPRLYDDNRLPFDDTSTGARSKFFNRNVKDCGVMFESGSISLTGRISKTALFRADVIAQVDRKFILVKMPLRDSRKAGSDALIMLDQHAVDERCKLEDLMSSYFEADGEGDIRAKVEFVDKPLVFEFADRELELLEQHRVFLGAWGITYDVQRSRKRNRTGECIALGYVKVTGLPPSIAERCGTEPQLLAELLRREVWDLSDSGHTATAPFFAFAEEDSWVSNFHRCPRGILDLLHSRACRSAIMFNDVLTSEDCEVLLERLTRCSFPFQCAHGRPSMAPLVDLGTGSRIGGWSEEGHVPQWKRWMEN